MTRLSLRRLLIPAAVLLVLVVSHPSSSAHNETGLKAPRVSVLDSGEMVVSVDAHGAFPGLLTVKFGVDAAGAITGGEWALVVTYVEDLNPDGSVNPDPHPAVESEPHLEYIRIVDRGTLTGQVVSGTAATASDGSLLLTNVQLTVTSGSLTFESVNGGTGVLDVDPRATDAQGTLRLDF